MRVAPTKINGDDDGLLKSDQMKQMKQMFATLRSKYQDLKKYELQVPNKTKKKYIFPLISTSSKEKEEFLKAEENFYEEFNKTYIDAMMFKSIRADKDDYWSEWLKSATIKEQLAKGFKEQDLRKPLRIPKNPTLKYKATGKQGVIEIGKSSEYPLAQKSNSSKKQSVSWAAIKFSKNKNEKSIVNAIGRNFSPPPFGMNTERKDTLVGIIFRFIDVDKDVKVLNSTIKKYDGGTYGRPYYLATKELAEQYFKKHKFDQHINPTGSIFSDLHQLFFHGDDQYHNETLSRLKWEKEDPGCQIGIFTDNLNSRLLAQFRAIDLQNNLEIEWIPISFYLHKKKEGEKVFFYKQQKREEDLKEGLKSTDPETKSMALIIEFLNKKISSKVFNNINRQEKNGILNLLSLNKITETTKITFLEQLLNYNIAFLEFQEQLNLIQLLSKIILNTHDFIFSNTSLEEISLEDYLRYIIMLIRKDNQDSQFDSLEKKIGKNSALFLASVVGNLKVVKKILDDKEHPSIQVDNALITAVSAGNIEIVQLFLEYNADINLKDNNGNTPLIIAAALGNIEIVKLLLAHNADINIKNNNGDKVTKIMISKNKKEILNIFLLHKLNINIKNNNIQKVDKLLNGNQENLFRLIKKQEFIEELLNYYSRNENKFKFKQKSKLIQIIKSIITQPEQLPSDLQDIYNKIKTPEIDTPKFFDIFSMPNNKASNTNPPKGNHSNNTQRRTN